MTQIKLAYVLVVTRAVSPHSFWPGTSPVIFSLLPLLIKSSRKKEQMRCRCR